MNRMLRAHVLPPPHGYVQASGEDLELGQAHSAPRSSLATVSNCCVRSIANCCSLGYCLLMPTAHVFLFGACVFTQIVIVVAGYHGSITLGSVLLTWCVVSSVLVSYRIGQRWRSSRPPWAFHTTWTARKGTAAQISSVRDISWWRQGAFVDVRVNSAEWIKVQSKFATGGLQGTTQLVRITRIENRWLWRRYAQRRAELVLKRGDSGAIEYHLWHGTRGTSPQTILQDEYGMDPRHSAQGFYGYGIYAAERACYSNQYAHLLPTARGQPQLQQVMLVRAVRGCAKDYGAHVDQRTRSLRAPPYEVGNSGSRYDSVIAQSQILGVPGSQSRITVFYDSSQIYPEYIVTYVDRAGRAAAFQAATRARNRATFLQAMKNVVPAAGKPSSTPDSEVTSAFTTTTSKPEVNTNSTTKNAKSDSEVPSRSTTATIWNPRGPGVELA